MGEGLAFVISSPHCCFSAPWRICPACASEPAVTFRPSLSTHCGWGLCSVGSCCHLDFFLALWPFWSPLSTLSLGPSSTGFLPSWFPFHGCPEGSDGWLSASILISSTSPLDLVILVTLCPLLENDNSLMVYLITKIHYVLT